VADIFISHSGNDNEVAAVIGERIRRERPTWSLFYDKDNIRAGERWQERLREELTSCRVVLALLSRNWLGSPWCFTEAVTAAFRGKDLVGIETEDLTSDELARAPPILHERQRVRLRDDDNRAWQKILEALDRSGLDPDDWFPTTPNVGPFPGLVAFDEKDAGVFFGRKQEITEYLAILDTLRGPDRSQILVISGGSGSGKSSLLRAGLIPRLRRKPNWVVISPFEVAREPVRNLFYRLGETLAGLGMPAHGLDPTKPSDDPDTLAQTLDEVLRRLEQVAGSWVMLPLDQAEALLADDRQASTPAKVLLGALAKVLGGRIRHVVVAATIRTEFVPRLETVFAGTEVRLRQAPLSALGSLAEVIHKPAERFGLELEAGLAERIIEDVHTADALPLLAYTLKALYDLAGTGRRLTLDSYQNLGGVRGAIAAKLETVLSDPEPTAEEARALQRAFTRFLVRVDEGAVEGDRLLRRVVSRASMPQAADRVVNRLVDAGLLLTKEATIELAHERLIDDWPKLPLKTWLGQDATDRRLIDQLRQRVNDDTLPDGLLSQAEDLLRGDHELTAEEPGIAQLVHRSRDQQRARERRWWIALGGVLFVAIILAAIGAYALVQKSEAQTQRDRARSQLLAIEARRASSGATTPDDIERAGGLALESIEIARKNGWSAEADAIETARSALTRLPLLILKQRGGLSSLVVLPDGSLASAGIGTYGEIKLWPKGGAGEPEGRSHGATVSSLAVLPDGRLLSADYEGKITAWSKDGVDEHVVHSRGPGGVKMAVLPDSRVASAGDDGEMEVWREDGTGEPEVRHLGHMLSLCCLVVLSDGQLVSGGTDRKITLWPSANSGAREIGSHDSNVSSLVALKDGGLASADVDGTIKLWSKDGTREVSSWSHGRGPVTLGVMEDGRLASAGGDGTIKIWSKDGAGKPVILTHGNPIRSLAVLPDGKLVSASENGEIKFWPKDGTGEPAVLTQGGPVHSLAVLKSGRLASDDEDGNIKLWPGNGVGQPVIWKHGHTIASASLKQSLIALNDGGLMSADDDGLTVWPVDGAGKPTFRSLDNWGWGGGLAILVDGRLATTGHDAKIRVWPQDGIGQPQGVSQAEKAVWWLSVLSDGRLAGWAYGGAFMVWSKDGAGEPATYLHGGPSVNVTSLVLLYDGRLASAGDDGKIKLWAKDFKGEPDTRMHGPGAVLSLAVLKDGRLASGGDDGYIKLWPREVTGEPVVLVHGSPILSLAVLSDGRLASGGKDGRIKLWLVDNQYLVAALCLRAGRNLSKEDWARYIGADSPWQPSCRDLSSNWRTPE
jgi:WD40 repeat protein